ncbi:hypothetical protein C4D60_Mb02t09300 [Musa balbisiana]|uniref:Uncharacterized protein n=1 Tax=Musa balbisiana TaxID=52838 RepID=A0A4S8I9D8_MUSBA|nr:hypothetical protein C4D60_Mb02t09300 [Musa balbisiana]
MILTALLISSFRNPLVTVLSSKLVLLCRQIVIFRPLPDRSHPPGGGGGPFASRQVKRNLRDATQRRMPSQDRTAGEMAGGDESNHRDLSLLPPHSVIFLLGRLTLPRSHARFPGTKPNPIPSFFPVLGFGSTRNLRF